MCIYSISKLDRLKDLLKVETLYTTFVTEEWMEIPYPSTFNNTNCIIIPTMTGTTYSNMYVFKTNLSRTKYSVRNIIGTSGDYAFYLIFIKILN